MNQTMIRVQKNKDNPYLLLNKTCINDNRLSWKAKGLHTYLMGLPDDWKIYISELITHSKDGRDSTISAINELEEYGYIVKEKSRNNKGQFDCMYNIYETPNIDIEPTPPKRKIRNGKTETENPKLLNNNKLNNNKLNNNTTTTGAKNENVVVSDEVTAIKEKIDKKLNAKISKKAVKELLKQCGLEKINYYLDNWDKFKSTTKGNIVGFFVKAVQEEYVIPSTEHATSNKHIEQLENFEQRQYSESDFEKYYYKVE